MARKQFHESSISVPLPNLMEIQTQSYEWFFKEALRELFDEISPVEDITGENYSLSFDDYTLGQPKITESTARARNLTYKASLHCKVTLTNKVTKKTKKGEVYFGDFPLMTDRGTFIINGVERVVVSQIVRSYGVLFVADDIVGRRLFGAKIIPARGAWLEFETSNRDVLSVKIDRKRKIPVTTLLRALGNLSEAKMKELFADVDTNDDHKYIEQTLARDPATTYEEALVEVYKRIRPGDLVTARASYQEALKSGDFLAIRAYGAFLERSDDQAARDYYAFLSQQPGAGRKIAESGLARLGRGAASKEFTALSARQGAGAAFHLFAQAMLQQAEDERARAGLAGFNVGSPRYNFPLVLARIAIWLDPDLDEAKFQERLVLTDGGVYDNLGVETSWKRFDTILVSDAGGSYEAEASPHRDWGRHTLRTLFTIDNQVRSLRRRQVVGAFRAKPPLKKGSFWSIASDFSTGFGVPSPLPCPIQQTAELAKISTRLGRLPDELQMRLINWGYAACDISVRKFLLTAASPPAAFPYPKVGV